MPIAPDIQAFLQQLKNDNIPDVAEQTVTEARGRGEYFLKLAPVPDCTGLLIEDHSFARQDADIITRLYRPQHAQHQATIVWFHGGGFVLGSLDQANALCVELVKQLNVQVFSVDYRLAPEYAFPVATEDSYAAVQWLLENAERLLIDPQSVYLAGTSAGANLATVTTLMMRDRQQGNVSGQILFYPVTDNNPNRGSYKKFGKGHYLTVDGMAWFWEKYMDDAQTALYSPYAFPMKADNLSKLPPAFIITAEYDLLLDEGKDYAQRLTEDGVAVEYRCAAGMIHGFSEFAETIPSAHETFLQLLQEIKHWMQNLK